MKLDPQDLLLENLRHSREARAPQATAERPETGSIDLDDLKGYLRRYHAEDNPLYSDTPERQGKAIIRRVIDGEPLAQVGCRGFTVFRAGAIVGLLLPPYTPVEVALELLRPSVSKIPTLDTDDETTDSIDAWLATAQRSYEGSQEKKAGELLDEQGAVGKLHAVIQARAAAAGADRSAQESSKRSTSADRSAPAHVLVPPEPPEPLEPERDDDDEWRLTKMKNTVDKKGFNIPKNTAANITAVLENHKGWKGVLRYNELTNEPEALGGPLPEGKREAKRLITAIRNWLTHEEDLDLPRFEVVSHVEFVALAQRYDPLRSYLTDLVWDGVPRIGRWLIDYCGARVTDDAGRDVTEYVKMVGEKWLMAGAARGLYPGCKADNVLVFEGNQYAGKSKMLGILGGEWFVDTRLSLGDKTTLELTTKSWIIELSELDSMRKSETGAQKAFFSNRIENFRLSYAPRVEKFPRRCIFAATTNEARYLLDLTGNRRFWSVWCEFLKINEIRRDRDQLWAEAVFRVRAGEVCPNCFGVDERCAEHRWWLDADQTAVAEEVATTRLKSEFADEIRSWWFDRMDPPAHLTTGEVLVTILGMTLERKEQYQVSIGRAMKSLGFERKQISVPGGREWVYVPSERLRTDTVAMSEAKKSPGGIEAKRRKLSESIARARDGKGPQSFVMPEPKEPV